MSFLDTVPAAIDPLDPGSPWERFRVRDPRRSLAALREACHADTPIALSDGHAPSVTASLWAVDDAAGRLHFNLNGSTRDAVALARCPLLWAVMYQGDVKLQFPLRGMAVGHLQATRRGVAPAGRSLVAELPTMMYAMPRRRALRVRRANQRPPTLHFTHPLAPGSTQCLDVLDISLTGCALRNRAGAPPLAAGMELRGVEVELDAQTILFTDLRVQHVSPGPTDAPGSTRIGCRWHDMPHTAVEALAQWIAGGKRRRDLISLSFG